MQKHIKRYFPIFLLPTILAFLIAFIIPFILGIYLSFCKFTTVTNAHLIGFGNYVNALKNKDFLNALFFTLKFTVVSVILINFCAFLLALLLTKKVRGTNVFRTIFFMPNLIGGIVLGYIWQVILNGILLHFGVTLLFKAEYGFWGLVIVSAWQMIGYMMVIYIAGIQNIPGDLIEAAEIDGATRLQTLIKVKIPIMMPSITICLFLTLSNCMKCFDTNLALTDGAPSKKTAMLALHIYDTFYGRVGNEGTGQATAVIFFIFVAVIAFIQLTITRGREQES